MQDDPFASFKPSAVEPADETKPEKKKRGGRRKKPAVIDGNSKPTPESSKIMVPIGAIAACRHLDDHEIKFTIAVAGGIAELSKASQRHVVAALSKIFS